METYQVIGLCLLSLAVGFYCAAVIFGFYGKEAK